MKKRIERIVVVIIVLTIVTSFLLFFEVVKQQSGEGKYLIVLEDGYLQYYHSKYGKWPTDLNGIGIRSGKS